MHTLSYTGSWVRAQRPMGVTLPKDAATWETNHAENERQQARRERR
jgi:hypothetical protein